MSKATPDPGGHDEAVPRSIWVLIASALVIALGYGLIAPVLPQFATSFGVDATAAAVVVSAFAFFRLLFAPAAGRLIVRLGERPTYLAGLLIVAASTGATGFANSYWQLVLFRSLGGIGSVMFTVSAVALLVRMAPADKRGRVSSYYGSAFLIGGITGPIVGGALGGLGLHVPFLVYAVALLIAAAIVFVGVHPDSVRPDPNKPALPPLTVAVALRDPAYRASLVSSFANGWSNFGVRNAILPLFIAATIGREPWQSGLVLAIFAGGNAIGLTLAGRYTDIMGRRPFVFSGLVISGVATLATGVLDSLVLVTLASLIAGFGSGLVNPSLQATLADIVGRERSGGPALATAQMATDAGVIVGPIVAGVLIDHGSYPAAFISCGLILLGAAAMWRWAAETLPSKRPDTATASG